MNPQVGQSSRPGRASNFRDLAVVAESFFYVGVHIGVQKRYFMVSLSLT